jgi:hypothetical protein
VWFAALALFGLSQATTGQNPLPQDAKATCTISKADFAKWFANGMIQKNGLVKPADSLDFKPSSACDFYRWSWQMFMWTTSPEHMYGGKGLVIDSPVFYDVSPTVNGQRRFIANTGRAIKNFAIFRSQLNQRGKHIRINKAGKLVETEEGQATGDALMAQTGSLVYYGVHANDVYAYFLTGNKDGEIKPTQNTFPATKAQLGLVTAFAAKHKKKFPDSIALVVELKTSWVEVTKLPNANQYIQITGILPVYTKTSTKWTATGKTRKVTMALVGMHVVGTVQNHPEMVWATFEHVGNAPNDKYTYTNTKNKTVTVPESTAGKWLFCKSKSTGPFNVSHMTVPTPGDNIVATMGNTISPSDTLRKSPWGEDPAKLPGSTANNTQIISLNNNVLKMIPAGDLRKNYVLIGATWTNGKIPGFSPPPVPIIGSQKLVNATMETYAQPTDCFDCHQGSKGNGLGSPGGFGLSHIYGDLQGLKLP